MIIFWDTPPKSTKPWVDWSWVAIISESLAWLMLMVEAYIVILGFQLPYCRVLASVLFEDPCLSQVVSDKVCSNPLPFTEVPGVAGSQPNPIQWVLDFAGGTLDKFAKIWTMNDIPSCSMYSIFTYIWVILWQMLVNIPYMDIHGAHGIIHEAEHLWSCPNMCQNGESLQV